MITVSFPAPKGVFRAGKATTCSGRPPSPPLQFLLPAWVTAHTSHLAAMAALQVITKQELDCTSMHMRAPLSLTFPSQMQRLRSTQV